MVVADDHPVIVESLKRAIALADDLCWVAAAADGNAAIEAVGAQSCDVVVYDLSMPHGGLDGIERLCRAHPAVAVIVFSGTADAAAAYRAFVAGARGYVVKSADVGALIRAIRDVASGLAYLDPQLGADLIRSLRAGRGVAANVTLPLSKREHEVLRRVALGHSNREAAEQLGLSVKTVETYRARAMSKLDLRTSADIFRLAIEAGWILPE